MGQRFLVSRPVLTKIIAAAELKPTDTVLEIGAGRGELTRALAERAGRVIAVEKDPRFVRVLGEMLRQKGVTNVTLISGDILKIPISQFLNFSISYRVVANIPYYLTSRLIRRLLEAEHPPKDILVMVQKEVAERICAKPPKMNLLGLSVQAYGRPKILFAVPASAFSPPPKVDSALIRITNIGKLFFIRHQVDEPIFFAILRAAFRGKRKTLENSLSKNLRLPKRRVAEIIADLKLSGQRPEMVSLEAWTQLMRALAKEMQ